MSEDEVLVFNDRVGVLADAIRSGIEAGRLSPGTKLPGERDMAERYRVSRNTVREALRELEAVGLVHRRHGSGTYVADEPLLAFSSSMGAGIGQGNLLDHVMDLRLVVEPGIARRAALRAGGQLLKLKSLVDMAAEEMGRTPPDRGRLRKLDMDFHGELARLARNPLLRDLLEMSNELIAPSRADEYLTMDRVRSSIGWHRRILEAVAARDSDGAFRAMEEHLFDVKGFTTPYPPLRR